MKNISVEKSYTKCGGETITGPFSKKSKLSISLHHWSKNQAADHLLLPYIKLFEKTKSSLELVCLPHFQHDF